MSLKAFRPAGLMIKAQNRFGGRRPGMAWRHGFMNRSYDHHFRLLLLDPGLQEPRLKMLITGLP
jgi:hypothetical protein